MNLHTRKCHVWSIVIMRWFCYYRYPVRLHLFQYTGLQCSVGASGILPSTSLLPLPTPGNVISMGMRGMLPQSPSEGGVLIPQKYSENYNKMCAVITGTGPGSSCFSTPVYSAAWARAESFDEIIVSAQMVSNHLPDAVLKALDQLDDRCVTVQRVLKKL